MKIDEIPGAIKYSRAAIELEWLGKPVQYMQRHELQIFLGWLCDYYAIDQKEINLAEKFDVKQAENENDVVQI